MFLIFPTRRDVVTSFGQQPVFDVLLHFAVVTYAPEHFLQVAHAVFAVALHAFDWNLPLGQTVHLEQVVSFFSWHAIRLYDLSAHLVHAVHSRSALGVGVFDCHSVAEHSSESSEQ